MKLSKAVKEYISEQIRIKAENNQRIEELRRKADERSEAYEKDADLLREKYEEAANNLARKYGVDEKHIGLRSLGCSWDLPEVKAYDKAKEELEEKRRLAELNIIATMELGGNKEDLMKMLEALEF